MDAFATHEQHLIKHILSKAKYNTEMVENQDSAGSSGQRTRKQSIATVYLRRTFFEIPQDINRVMNLMKE